MKRIVCEVCDSTDIIKDGGTYICQSCGMKYSQSEIKSLLRDVEGEPTPDLTSAPAPVMPSMNPNQQQIDNILVLATTAYEAQNYQEAENYCNRAIELDASAYKAWFLKGKAVGWQSTTDKLRIEEAAHSFCKAIDFAPEEEKEEIKNQAADELKRLGLALVDLRKQRFSNWPDQEEYDGLIKAKDVLRDSLLILLSRGNSVSMPEGYLDEVAVKMNEAGVAGFKKTRKLYDELDRPGSKAWKDALTMADLCADIILQAINASDDDDEADITRYENLAAIYEYTIGMTAYANEYSTYRDWSLTENAKRIRINKIAEWGEKVGALKFEVSFKKAGEEQRQKREKEERIKAYWEAHVDEKTALETEKAQLVEKTETISNEINKHNSEIAEITKLREIPVHSKEESAKIQQQIMSLEKRRSSLGLFSGKEKKQIGDEIASLNGRIDALKPKIEAEEKEMKEEEDRKLQPIKQKLDELEAELGKVTLRIKAIEAEFEKDPSESE